MDNNFLSGLIKFLPNNDRGKMTEVEKGVETMKRNALLTGLGALASAAGLALFQGWINKKDSKSPKWSNNSNPNRK